MSLEIVSMQLGPAFTNAYLVGDSEAKTALVIDPAWDGGSILEQAKKRDWEIGAIWLTHAHFDHLGGLAEVAACCDPPLPVAMHPDDLWLWQQQGMGGLFGFDIDAGPEPSIQLHHQQRLSLAGYEFEVRHAPGHTPGHVMFYCSQEKVMFVGDVIFENGIGRTDLPRGDFPTLLDSIHSQVMTLPDETRLLCGHGGETTVGREREENPFIQ